MFASTFPGQMTSPSLQVIPGARIQRGQVVRLGRATAPLRRRVVVPHPLAHPRHRRAQSLSHTPQCRLLFLLLFRRGRPRDEAKARVVIGKVKIILLDVCALIVRIGLTAVNLESYTVKKLFV